MGPRRWRPLVITKTTRRRQVKLAKRQPHTEIFLKTRTFRGKWEICQLPIVRGKFGHYQFSYCKRREDQKFYLMEHRSNPERGHLLAYAEKAQKNGSKNEGSRKAMKSKHRTQRRWRPHASLAVAKDPGMVAATRSVSGGGDGTPALGWSKWRPAPSGTPKLRNRQHHKLSLLRRYQ